MGARDRSGLGNLSGICHREHRGHRDNTVRLCPAGGSTPRGVVLCGLCALCGKELMRRRRKRTAGETFPRFYARSRAGFPPSGDRSSGPGVWAGPGGRLRPPSVSASRIRLRFQRWRAPVLARWGKGAAACRRSPMPARQFLRMVLPSPCQVSRDQTSTS